MKTKILEKLKSLEKGGKHRNTFGNRIWKSFVAVVFHYLSMSKKHLESCNTNEVKLKDYFYCLRTTLASKWVIEKGTFPPVIFHEMLDLLPENIFTKVQFLLNVKSENGEKYWHPQDWELFEYLKSEIEKLSAVAKTLRPGNLDKNEAEKVFVEILNLKQ